MASAYAVLSRLLSDMKWVKSRNHGEGCIFHGSVMSRDGKNVMYVRTYLETRYEKLQI